MTYNDDQEMEPGLNFWSCIGKSHIIADSDDKDEMPSQCERARDDNSLVDSRKDQEMPDLLDPEDSLDSEDESIGPSYNPSQGKDQAFAQIAQTLSKGKQAMIVDTDFQELDNYSFHKEDLDNLPDNDLESLPELLNPLDNDSDDEPQDMPSLMNPADSRKARKLPH